MTERNLLIAGVIALIVIAGVGGGIAKYKESTKATPTPSAGADLLFGGEQSKQQGQQSNAQNVQQQQQPVQQQKQVKQYSKFPGVYSAAELASKKAVIQTTKGNIEFEIFPDVPKAASNFIFLTNEGFYNGLTFHRVEPGFVIQGGDPVGNGTGGPGYKFEDEPVTLNYDKGIVAMANSGPNTNGSQFFIMLENNPTLPKNYTIFGKVTKGQEVVDKIVVGDVMQKVTIEPLQ